LHRALRLIALIVLGTACASRARTTETIAIPLLPSDELAIVADVVRAEAEEYRSERPAILLDRTSTSMPRPEDELPVPDDFPREEWLAQNPPVPDILRAANRSPFQISKSARFGSVTLFSQQRYEREYGSEGRARALARLFNGREPAVITVSRPALDDQGRAHLLVHVFYAWNEHGVISYCIATRDGDTWSVERMRPLVLWSQ
jgi:hypothetical protein